MHVVDEEDNKRDSVFNIGFTFFDQGVLHSFIEKQFILNQLYEVPLTL